MAKKDKRFQIVLNESPVGGIGMAATIWLDTHTGMLYLLAVNGYGGGLTPLLDGEGKPTRWDLDQIPEELL